MVTIEITAKVGARIRSSKSLTTISNVVGLLQYKSRRTATEDFDSHGVVWWRIQEGWVHNSVAEEITLQEITIPSNFNPLDMKNVPQWGLFANGKRADCGPACLASWLNFFTGKLYTVDQLSVKVPNVDGYTTHADLIRLAGLYGLKLKSAIYPSFAEVEFPFLALVMYRFDRHEVWDKNFTGLHWLTLLHINDDGSTINNDPDYGGLSIRKGDRVTYSKAGSDKSFIRGGKITGLILDR